MITAEFMISKPEMAHNRTYQDFSKFINIKPQRLGILSQMYNNLTASYLTEGMGNVIYNKKDTGNRYQKLNSLMYEWQIDVKFIKRIKFAAKPTDSGANGSDILMAFQERYYEVDETFIIEGSKQQCIVKESPIRKSDKYWEYLVQLIDPTYGETLLTDYCEIGMETRFLANIKSELHEQGFAKWQGNVESHRQWITEHRVDIDASARYLAHEDSFIKVANGDDKDKVAYFQLPEIKKQLLEAFMEVRNQALLWQKGTMDANGKSSVVDRQGRPMIAGDGAIPQINRFAGKYGYAKLSIQVFNKAISTLIQKAANSEGNTFMFISNDIASDQIQNTLAEYLSNFKVDNAFIATKSGEKIKVGAAYDAYTYRNNTIIFRNDRALSIEHPDKGYSILIDYTMDKSNGQAAISLFTLEGQEIIQNDLQGVGGKSGSVASPVAGNKYIASGYAGIGVFTPYRSFILFEQ